MGDDPRLYGRPMDRPVYGRGAPSPFPLGGRRGRFEGGPVSPRDYFDRGPSPAGRHGFPGRIPPMHHGPPPARRLSSGPFPAFPAERPRPVYPPLVDPRYPLQAREGPFSPALPRTLLRDPQSGWDVPPREPPPPGWVDADREALEAREFLKISPPTHPPLISRQMRPSRFNMGSPPRPEVEAGELISDLTRSSSLGGTVLEPSSLARVPSLPTSTLSPRLSPQRPLGSSLKLPQRHVHDASSTAVAFGDNSDFAVSNEADHHDRTHSELPLDSNNSPDRMHSAAPLARLEVSDSKNTSDVLLVEAGSGFGTTDEARKRRRLGWGHGLARLTSKPSDNKLVDEQAKPPEARSADFVIPSAIVVMPTSPGPAVEDIGHTTAPTVLDQPLDRDSAVLVSEASAEQVAVPTVVCQPESGTALAKPDTPCEEFPDSIKAELSTRIEAVEAEATELEKQLALLVAEAAFMDQQLETLQEEGKEMDMMMLEFEESEQKRLAKPVTTRVAVEAKPDLPPVFKPSKRERSLRSRKPKQMSFQQLLEKTSVGRHTLEALQDDNASVIESSHQSLDHLLPDGWDSSMTLTNDDLFHIGDHLAAQHSIFSPMARQFLAQRRTLLQLKNEALANLYRNLVDNFRSCFSVRRSGRISDLATGSRVSTRSIPYTDVVRSDFQEQQVLNALQAMEKLRTMCKLPVLQLDTWEQRWSSFVNYNALVQDPLRELQEDKTGKDWSTEEKRIFMEKFIQYPKDFRTISSFLPRRSVAECIVFFYKHQKLDEFAVVRRKQQLKKRRLQTENKRQLYAPLYIAPVAKGRLDGGARVRGRGRGVGRGRGRGAKAETPAELPEDAADAADASDAPCLASPAAVGSLAVQRRGSDGDVAVDTNSTMWNDASFVEAVRLYGRDARGIAQHLGNKTQNAVKWYFSRNRRRLGLDDVIAERQLALQEPGANEASAAAGAGGGDGMDAGWTLQETRATRSSLRELDVDQALASPVRQTTSVAEPKASSQAESSETLDANASDDGDVDDDSARFAGKGVPVSSPNAPHMRASRSGSIPASISLFQGAPSGSSPPFSLARQSDDVLGAAMRSTGAQAQLQLLLQGGMLATPASSSAPASHSSLLSSQLLPSPSQLTAHGSGQSPKELVGLPLSSLLGATPSVVGTPSLFMGQSGSHISRQDSLGARETRGEGGVVASTSGRTQEEVLAAFTRRGGTAWTAEERERFIEMFRLCGRDWHRLQEAVPSKTLAQIKTFYQNYKTKLGLDKMEAAAGIVHHHRRVRLRADGGGGGRSAQGEDEVDMPSSAVSTPHQSQQSQSERRSNSSLGALGPHRSQQLMSPNPLAPLPPLQREPRGFVQDAADNAAAATSSGLDAEGLAQLSGLGGLEMSTVDALSAALAQGAGGSSYPRLLQLLQSMPLNGDLQAAAAAALEPHGLAGSMAKDAPAQSKGERATAGGQRQLLQPQPDLKLFGVSGSASERLQQAGHHHSHSQQLQVPGSAKPPQRPPAQHHQHKPHGMQVTYQQQQQPQPSQQQSHHQQQQSSELALDNQWHHGGGSGTPRVSSSAALHALAHQQQLAAATSAPLASYTSNASPALKLGAVGGATAAATAAAAAAHLQSGGLIGAAGLDQHTLASMLASSSALYKLPGGQLGGVSPSEQLAALSVLSGGFNGAALRGAGLGGSGKPLLDAALMSQLGVGSGAALSALLPEQLLLAAMAAQDAQNQHQHQQQQHQQGLHAPRVPTPKSLDLHLPQQDSEPKAGLHGVDAMVNTASGQDPGLAGPSGSHEHRTAARSVGALSEPPYMPPVKRQRLDSLDADPGGSGFAPALQGASGLEDARVQRHDSDAQIATGSSSAFATGAVKQEAHVGNFSSLAAGSMVMPDNVPKFENRLGSGMDVRSLPQDAVKEIMALAGGNGALLEVLRAQGIVPGGSLASKPQPAPQQHALDGSMLRQLLNLQAGGPGAAELQRLHFGGSGVAPGINELLGGRGLLPTSYAMAIAPGGLSSSGPSDRMGHGDSSGMGGLANAVPRGGASTGPGLANWLTTAAMSMPYADLALHRIDLGRLTNLAFPQFGHSASQLAPAPKDLGPPPK